MKNNKLILENNNEKLGNIENIYQDIRGKKIIDTLSSKLTNEFGSSFSSVSIRRMRRFYEFYPIWSAVLTKLAWTHFQELIKIIKDEKELYELVKEGVKNE